MIGGEGYKAPEMLKGVPYGTDVDWWCLGAIMYKLLSGKHPFTKTFTLRNKDHYIKNLRVGNIKPIKGFSKAANDCILKLLHPDPEKRLGHKCADDIKSHSFYKKVDWEKVLNREVDTQIKDCLEIMKLPENEEP